MGITTLIVCTNLKNGNKMLSKLLGDFDHKKVDYYVTGENQTTVRFENGDSYSVVLEGHASKGRKFDKVYVDETVSKGFIDSCLSPFSVGEDWLIVFD